MLGREEGMSLIELLVVLALLSLVGGSILAVATTTLRAERTAEDLARNLDATRIAVERVRDEVRGADGVCEGSDDRSMAVWIDRAADGTVNAGEVVTFTLEDADIGMALRRGDDDGERTIVRRLVDRGVFTYLDEGRQAVLPNLSCDVGATPDVSAAQIVDLEVEVEGHGVDTSGPLVVATTIVMRNATLAGGSGQPDGTILVIASISANDDNDDGVYNVRAVVGGLNFSHPLHVTLEARCGEQAWTFPAALAYEPFDHSYHGTWDSNACGAATGTLRVTATDGEEEATGDLTVTLQGEEPEEALDVTILAPEDGATVAGEQAIELAISGVPDGETATVDVTVEHEGGSEVYATSGEAAGDGTWHAGTWSVSDAAVEGAYDVSASVATADASAEDSVTVTVEGAPQIIVARVEVDTSRGNWRADVEFVVTDGHGSPVEGAIVEYEVLSPGGEPGGSCTTTMRGGEAICEADFPDRGNLRNNDVLTIAIEDVAREGYAFDPSASVTEFSVNRHGLVE